MLSNKNQELQRLKTLVEELYGFEISKGGRKREFVYAKKVYSKIARDRGHTFSSISRSLNHTHATILFYYKTFHSIMDLDVDIYKQIIKIYKEIPEMKDENLSVKVEAKDTHSLLKARYEVLVSELKNRVSELESEIKESESNKDILDMMSEWTEKEKEDFIKFRMNPYSASLKNRVFR
jgi:hypothetical protein